MKLLKSIRKDHLLHLLAGVYIYLVCRIFLPAKICLFIVLIAAQLKELLWDHLLKKGTPEAADIVLTALGGITTSFLTDYESFNQ